MKNRVYKFRAWDKEEKKMVLPDNSEHDAFYNFEGWNVSDVFAVNSLLNGEISKRYIWQQYTGLKDKNGKGQEVYFGDIAKDKYGQIFEIKWDYSLLAYLETIWFKIIGNIYENPELLL